MKRLVASVIVLGVIAIGITVEASDHDCEITIDASEHDEGNPAFPTSGCDDMPALGWYDEQEFILSGFSGMTEVTDGEIMDLGMGTNVKVITIDKDSKPQKKSKHSKSDSTKNDSTSDDSDKKSGNDKVVAKEKNEEQDKQKGDIRKEQETSGKKEELADEGKTDDETAEVLKDKEDSLASNSTRTKVLTVAGIVIIGVVGLFLVKIKRKIS